MGVLPHVPCSLSDWFRTFLRRKSTSKEVALNLRCMFCFVLEKGRCSSSHGNVGAGCH